MTLPTFLLIGAMKAGTTSLHHYLGSHPQVFMSRPKEINFFNDERNYTRGMEWYARHFDPVSSETAIGESSTGYTKHPSSEGVHERIARDLPNVRLLYVVRNPIDRMRSHFMHEVGSGRETNDITAALTSNPSYVQISSYAMQIEKYLECFPRNQVLVVTSEDLKDRRAATMRRIYSFVGVDDGLLPEDLDREYYRSEDKAEYRPAARRVRALPGLGAISSRLPLPLKRMHRRLTTRAATTDRSTVAIPPALRAELEARLRDDVARLYRYVEGPFDGWGIA